MPVVPTVEDQYTAGLGVLEVGETGPSGVRVDCAYEQEQHGSA